MRSWLRILRHTAFAALVAACAALAVLNVQAWRGGLVDEAPSSSRSVAPGGSSAEASDQVASSAADAAPATSSAAGEIVTAPSVSSVREPAGASTTITVKATSGPCWLLARAGSASGKVLYEGVLAKGKSLSLSRDRVWLRLGAPANVRLSLNGEAVREMASGTTDLIATSAGVRPASTGA